MRDWFRVDPRGLRKLLKERGVAFVLYELVANAWDAPGTTRVDIILEPIPGEPKARLNATDDAPEGFRRLEHAWTLFAESERKSDPGSRGRWNIGEKLVLSMCDHAEIVSTTGGVRFDDEGRHSLRRRREAGSEFSAIVQLTREQIAEISRAALLLLPPVGVTLHYNGIRIDRPAAVGEFISTLPTEIADAEGALRRSRRSGLVRVHAADDHGAWICELGIPVVQVDLPWTVDVQQKVPLTLDRCSVADGFRRELEVALLAHMHEEIPEDQLQAAWVRKACASPSAAPGAVKDVLVRRFGEDAVAYDPSDPEGSKMAMASGRAVVHGGSLSAGEWDNARRAGVLEPAGHVTPSPRVLCSPDGVPHIPRDKWRPFWATRAVEIRRLARLLLGFDIEVGFQSDLAVGGSSRAWYGNRAMTLHVVRLGSAWFEAPLCDERVLSLILHELAHEYCGDHLSMQYQETCCKLGARLAALCAENPGTLITDAGRRLVAAGLRGER